MPSSSTFLHSCRRSWLFSSDTHCCHGPVSMSVSVSIISPSCVWCYHFFQRKLIKLSLIILLLLPVRIFQHPQYKCIYRNTLKVQHLVNLVQVYSLASLSRTSAPLLVALSCMIFQVCDLFPPPCLYHDDAVMKEGSQSCFLLVRMIPVLDHW